MHKTAQNQYFYILSLNLCSRIRLANVSQTNSNNMVRQFNQTTQEKFKKMALVDHKFNSLAHVGQHFYLLEISFEMQDHVIRF